MMTVHVEQSVSAHLVQRCSSSLGESHAMQRPMAGPESPALQGSKTLCAHLCRNWRYVCDGRGGESGAEGAGGVGGVADGYAAGIAWKEFNFGRSSGSCVSAITATGCGGVTVFGSEWLWGRQGGFGYEWGRITHGPLRFVGPSRDRVWAKGGCPFLLFIVRFG